MTNREEEIVRHIKKNPMISQKELSECLGITRSSTAVHITNLMKKGRIKGKGYILNEAPYVCVIGGTNIDIQGFPANDFVPRDSNPGTVKISLGGVGRNIAENLSRLGAETKLITALGNDVYGNKIMEEARMVGLDMQHSLLLAGQSTSTYLCILDSEGDMLAAIASMDIIEQITVEFIQRKKPQIENAQICLLDTNIPRETIEYIVAAHKDTCFFLDTVSSAKAKKVKDIIGKFHTIKPNKIEAEVLSGLPITNNEDLKKCGDYFLRQGVRQVFITLGNKGVYYNNGATEAFLHPPKAPAVSATGAGDAFMAAIIYGKLHEFPLDYAARFAVSASILALSHADTIHPGMSYENVLKKMEELKLC
jgi:pseudouridine kinase